MSTLIAAQRTSADVFHPNQVVWQSHPDHLASLARMFGLRPQPIDRCRVLELGCGAGRNLLPMADRHPESTFVGVDETASTVAAARQAAAATGFENVEFRNLNLRDVDGQLGTFDYIICHDVFSRVAPELQDTLLEACRARLNPEGVVYLSYRSLPGWMVAGVVRGMLRTGATQGQPIQQEIVRVRRVLDFVSQSLAADESPYARLLKGETELARSLSDPSLVFEHLGAENHPVYLHQLAAQAANHELQAFGDANATTMFAARLGPAIAQRLAQIAPDDVSTQQLMDVLSNRSFHHSLLCHKNVAVHRQWSPASLPGLYLAGDLRPQGATAQPDTDQTARFVTADGSVISTVLPAAKIAFAHLGRIWPRAISFDELLQVVAAELPADDRPAHSLDQQRRDGLANALVECVANNFVQPYSEADRFVTAVSEHPRAGRWAQAEAQAALPVTNRRHEPVVLDEMSRNLLGYLDGQRDRNELLAIVVEAADKGQLTVLHGGIPATQGDGAADILNQVLDQSLARLAHHGLLVA